VSDINRVHSQLSNAELAEFLSGLPAVSRPVISNWFRSGGTIEWKADDSPVTLADKSAELALRDALVAQFPDDDILGEEHAPHRGSSGYAWIIDPIDGTRAFICGRPVFGTLVGLVRNDVPVAGLIDMPMLDECYVAVGDVATLNGTAISTSNVTTLRQARLATTAPEALLADSLDAFNRLSAGAATNSYGGDCHNYALLAAGHLDLVLEDGLATHDIMGVVQVIRAAGGVVTDKAGAPVSMRETTSLLAAATPALHAEALAIVRGKS
jgi:inositol-phosphate phosphatase/L-galactose 1-phosphate phosphatase/histidinol-phosphatase